MLVNSPDALIILGTLVLALLLVYFAYNSRLIGDDLPPGPRPLPFIGNAHQVPSEHPEKTFAKWGTQYGDVIYVKMLATPTLVINSIEVAQDLLDRRGRRYSGRPYFTVISDLLGWGEAITSLQLGERLRKQRRWLHESFYDKSALDMAQPTQLREAKVLLQCLLDNPECYSEHLNRFTRSIMLETIYGHTVTSRDDKYMQIADRALKGTNDVAAAGTNIVDALPILRHVPSWMLGRGIARLLKETRPGVLAAHKEPYALVANAMAAGESKPSMVRSLIEEYASKDTLAQERWDIMSASAMSYLGTSNDSHAHILTNVTLMAFILTMILFPSALVKAQEEIDYVIGNERLPTYDDRESLPYLECLLQEVYRWHSPIQFGLPHEVTEEDNYRGYRIPKGTMVMANLWLMTRNPELYPNPEAFRPERFLGLSPDEAKQMDPRNLVFGFGRRICPGRRFADASIWLAIASIVATFNVRKVRDAEGRETDPVVEFTSGSVSHPHDFECSITPRSERAARLIRAGAR
ncbi:cytochrome P450 [Daedalea quercina L-15889]|uniref:Cytochrome P450 n=1 Tax=Daedalea quercina L-15889 TaxID=1314783 RepID=A0A165QF57_9APHY|nr:cytochrome P450 [Daedalea quercina L-15889]